ncbi:hypothetical protein FRB95_007559 [Tulasnella sp. JGI-2019a]|nr:hypothetical protein FRB95_007559 [Tulasnella sp. JGI-2019a]
MFFGHCATLRYLILDTLYGVGTWKTCTDFVASCDALETLELRRLQVGDLLSMNGHIEKLISKSLVDLRLVECSDATTSAILCHTASTSIERLCIGAINYRMGSMKSPPPDVLDGLPGLRTICVLISGTEYACRVIGAISSKEQTRRLSVQILDIAPSATTPLGNWVAFAGSTKFTLENCALM